MSHVYTPTPTPLGDITLPDDDDNADAASINTPLEALADAVAATAYPSSVQAVITASDPTYDFAALRNQLDSAAMVHFVIVGGGGAGAYPSGTKGGGGGGQGAILDQWLPAAEVPDTISIIVDPGAPATSSGTPESDGSFSSVGWTVSGNVSLVANGGSGGLASGDGGLGGTMLRANQTALVSEGSTGGSGGAGGGPDPGEDGQRSTYGSSGGAGGNLGGGSAGRGWGAGGGGVGSPVSLGGGGGGAGGYGLDLKAGVATGSAGGAGGEGVVIITVYRGTVS